MWGVVANIGLGILFDHWIETIVTITMSIYSSIVKEVLIDCQVWWGMPMSTIE